MDIVSVSHSGQAGPVLSDTQSPGPLKANPALIQTIQEINDSQVLGGDSQLTLAIDQQTRLPVIRVISRQTDQLVMQLPAEYVLQLHESLQSRPDTYQSFRGAHMDDGRQGPSNGYY